MAWKAGAATAPAHVNRKLHSSLKRMNQTMAGTSHAKHLYGISTKEGENFYSHEDSRGIDERAPTACASMPKTVWRFSKP